MSLCRLTLDLALAALAALAASCARTAAAAAAAAAGAAAAAAATAAARTAAAKPLTTPSRRSVVGLLVATAAVALAIALALVLAAFVLRLVILPCRGALQVFMLADPILHQVVVQTFQHGERRLESLVMRRHLEDGPLVLWVRGEGWRWVE